MRIILLLFLCVWAYAKTPQDTIIVAVENESQRINPLFDEDHDAILDFVYSGLTRFDESMRVQPDLATSWEVDSKNLEYTFYLRKDVLWHDGVPLSAKDVKFTLDWALDSRLNAPIRENFVAIKKIEVIDDWTIKISLKEPYQGILDVLSVGILPKHRLEGKDLNTDSFNQNPIGTGPFVFEEWKKGQYIRLKANKHYHLGQVKTPKMIVRFIADPSLVAIELENKKIDVGLVGQDMAQNFSHKKGYKVKIYDSADYRALMFNLQNPLFEDKRVREALNYVVDREGMAKTLLHGLGSVAQHPLEKSWVNPSASPVFVHDHKKAVEILRQAGWKKNKEGWLEKNGKVFAFDIYAMSNDPLRVALATILHSEFKKLGIKAKVLSKPSGSFDYTQVDSFLIGWGSPYDPDMHTYRVFGSGEGWNFGHYRNSAVDNALRLARFSDNKEERKKYYQDFIAALHDDPPFIFLVYLQFPLVYLDHVKGIKDHILGHHGGGFAWNVWEWSKE